MNLLKTHKFEKLINSMHIRYIAGGKYTLGILLYYLTTIQSIDYF